MKTIKVSAPGKIHLLGEHAVVYGRPALLAAIDKRCVVEITKRTDKKIAIMARNISDFVVTDEEEIIAVTKEARKNKEEFFETNDSSLLKISTLQDFDYVKLIIGETLFAYNKKFASGFSLVIDSQIPVGFGLGSSAALAISLIGALTIFLKEPFDKEKINKIAFLCEQYIHGYPSGGDTSTCCYGGFLWYRKEAPELKVIQPVQIALSESIAKNFFLLDTGKPKESTGEMVSLVKTFVKKHPVKANKIFADQEALVKELFSALQKNDEQQIIAILKNGEKNLEQIHVVSTPVKKIIRKIERSGGAAKICGGGGKTSGTGILLGYQNNYNNSEYDTIVLGTEGITIHEE